jgi:hypothetical protein
MTRLLQSMRASGEAAWRRAQWAFAGVGIGVIALGCATAALVDGLMTVAPPYVAFAAAALFLLGAAIFCLSRAGGADAPTNGAVQGSLAPGSDDGDLRTLLNSALLKEAMEKPARAAAIAAIAGLILGAVEALDEGRFAE